MAGAGGQRLEEITESWGNKRPRGGKNNYVFPAWFRRPTGCLIVDYARGKEGDGAAWSKVLLRLIERIQPEHAHAARALGELVRIRQFDELIALIQEALKEKTNECPIERRGGQPSGCG